MRGDRAHPTTMKRRNTTEAKSRVAEHHDGIGSRPLGRQGQHHHPTQPVVSATMGRRPSRDSKPLWCSACGQNAESQRRRDPPITGEAAQAS
jgi:hypothetical protein